jgi:hypothetical protein
MRLTVEALAVVGQLRGDLVSEETAVAVSAGFIRLLVVEPGTRESKSLILDAVLNNITHGRMPERVIPELLKRIQRSLGLLSFRYPEIQGAVKDWFAAHRRRFTLLP